MGARQIHGFELYGKVLGIVGVGRVGQQVARRAHAFGMKLLGADPFLSDNLAHQLHIQQASNDEIFAKADYITLHAALTDQTHHFISASSLAKCKDGVRLSTAPEANSWMSKPSPMR